MRELERVPLEPYEKTFDFLYPNGRHVHVAENERAPEHFIVPKAKARNLRKPPDSLDTSPFV